MITWILATRNAHKAQEIQEVLSDQSRYLTLRDLPEIPEATEDADTFKGNASKKALHLSRWLAAHPDVLAGRPLDPLGALEPREFYCLADDSGLEVDAIGGAPGVHSARFAALDTGAPGNSPDAANTEKLLRLLKGVPAGQRTARFRCVLAVSPVVLDGAPIASSPCSAEECELGLQLFEGVCEGCILAAPRGDHGFGYDPIFRPLGYEQSFGQLGAEVKSRISHRAQALGELRKAFCV